MIHKANIRKADEWIFFCDECEAVWLDAAEIGVLPWQDLTTMMRSRNLPSSAAELLVLGYWEH